MDLNKEFYIENTSLGSISFSNPNEKMEYFFNKDARRPITWKNFRDAVYASPGVINLIFMGKMKIHDAEVMKELDNMYPGILDKSSLAEKAMADEKAAEKAKAEKVAKVLNGDTLATKVVK